MGRFDGPIAAVRGHLAGELRKGRARFLDLEGLPPWPASGGLVLAHETGLELGSPAEGSLAVVGWRAADSPPAASPGAYLIGPDLGELDGSVPFGRVVVLRVAPELEDEYELYLDVQDALASTALEGVSVRARPSSQSVWYRVGRDALDRGLSMAHLGAALIRDLEAVAGVEEATVLLVVGSRAALAPLEGAARDAGRLVAALVKSSEEAVAECDECDYSDICEESKGADR